VGRKKRESDPGIAARVREIREQTGLSTAAFAAALEISSSQQGRYELGELVPDAVYLLRLRSVFDVDVMALLLGDVAPSTGR
jgi:transcriptional regulator with XRE-family HTH domain